MEIARGGAADRQKLIPTWNEGLSHCGTAKTTRQEKRQCCTEDPRSAGNGAPDRPNGRFEKVFAWNLGKYIARFQRRAGGQMGHK
jgi:hypothetical protein